MKALLILMLQYFLSTRNKAFWGGILPVFYAVLLIYLKIYGVFDGNTKQFWFFSIIGITVLLGTWVAGREFINRKRKKEINKMISHDLK